MNVMSKSVNYLLSLIVDGSVDMDSDWSFTAADGNSALGENDWAAYAKHFLAEDTDAPANTKNRFKYPVAKSGTVFRSGVIAAKVRAAQQGELKIVKAADKLLEAMGADEDDEETVGDCGCAPGDPACKMDGCKGVAKKTDSAYERVHRVDMGDYLNSETSRMETTPEGFLKGRSCLTNVGVFSYRDPATGALRKEYRPAEEVFKSASIETLRAVPLTKEHPKGGKVNPENAKSVSVGSVGTDISNDAYRVYGTVVVTDAQAIKDVRAGMRALSCGYDCTIEYTSGNWMGVDYDVIQRNIKYNHVAIVSKARAGDDAALRLDGVGMALELNPKTEDSMSDTMKKVVIEGVEYGAEAKVIETLHALTRNDAALNTQLGEKETELDKATAERDSAVERADAAEAKLKLRNDSADTELEAAVQARLKLLDSARAAGVEVRVDMAEGDLKAAIIKQAYPKADLTGKSADYVQSRLDSALELLGEKGAEDEANRRSMSEQPPEKTTRVDASDCDPEAARLRMIEKLNKGSQQS